MEGQIALIWQPSVDAVWTIFVLLLVIGFILLITYLSARRIKKLFPLVALRDGIATHSFRKNYFSLEKARGALVLLLAFKQMLQSSKQMVMMFLIVAGLTFSAVASLTIYYNMIVDTDAFLKVVSGGTADVILVVNENEDAFLVQQRVANMPEVEQIYGFQSGVMGMMEELMIHFMVIEDADYLGDYLLVDGRFPVHENEIAISPVIENGENLAVGEIVVVSRGSSEEEFLVTGIVQNFQHAGMFSLVTAAGVRRLDSSFDFFQFFVDLVADVDVDEFIALAPEVAGDVFYTILDFERYEEAQIAGLGVTLTPIAIGNVVISGVVIVLALYMTIKTMITRRYKELGIQKALGFTNMQLMNQIALNLLPIVVIGALVGAITGSFGFNAIFISLLRGTGIASANLFTPHIWVVMLVMAMVALAYMSAIFLAKRVRKISAYELVSER